MPYRVQDIWENILSGSVDIGTATVFMLGNTMISDLIADICFPFFMGQRHELGKH